MESREKSIAGGMIYPATKSCTSCHNDKSPTWKADRYGSRRAVSSVHASNIRDNISSKSVFILLGDGLILFTYNILIIAGKQRTQSMRMLW